MDILIQWQPGLTLESVEKQVILGAYRFYRGNKTQTAAALGIAVRTLDNKLDAYKLNVDHEKERQSDERKQRNEFLERCRGPLTPNYVTTAASLVAQDAEKARHLNGAAAGVRVESPAQHSEKQSVPVPQRKEVQSVLPAGAAVGGSKRNR